MTIKLGPVIDVRIVQDRHGRWRTSVEGHRITEGARTVPGALADLLLAFGAREAIEAPDPCPEPLVFEPVAPDHVPRIPLKKITEQS